MLKFRFYNIDDNNILYKATATYKVLDNMGGFLCNFTNLKEAVKKAKQARGFIYKILEDENMNEIFNELWLSFGNV